MLKETVQLKRRPYEILLQSGGLEQMGRYLASAGLTGHAAIISDSNVAPLYGERVAGSMAACGYCVSHHVIAAGEASKSMEQAAVLCSELAGWGHDRSSFVVALGGGVVGDLGGFVAGIYYRGIPFVQVPTTIVAQVDSAVGGKTGVNLPEGKNLLGVFHQPALVVVDPEVLTTLPGREYREGFAEVIKHAAIRDAGMLRELRMLAPDDAPPPADLLLRNIAIKARIVEEDERELTGTRALLNFGHTLGHAIEASVPYGQMLHGEAISLGIKAALFLSRECGGLPQGDLELIESLLRHFGLPTLLPEQISDEVLLEKMQRDKKFVSGKRKFVLLGSAGEAYIHEGVNDAQLADAIAYLRRE